MSEKRFIVDDESYLIDMENKVIFGYNVTSYLLDLLNNLNDDVKHLEEYSGDLEADLRRFEEENEQLKKQVENLQEALAESWATLIMEGFEIEFDGKNLGKDCAKWIGVDEENLYDVVR